MGTLAIIVDEPAKSSAGTQALAVLHSAGAVTLYGLAIVTREPRGKGISVQEPLAKGTGAAAPSIGVAVGALVLLLGGPAAAAARTLESALLGTIRDLAEAGLSADFLEQVSHHLLPGYAAILADVGEASPLPLEAGIAPLKARILRQAESVTAPEEAMAREIIALRKRLAELHDDVRESEHFVITEAARRAGGDDLHRALWRARILLGALRRETAAKIEVLQRQAASLEGKARDVVEERARSVQASLASRALHLDQLAKAPALRPVRDEDSQRFL